MLSQLTTGRDSFEILDRLFNCDATFYRSVFFAVVSPDLQVVFLVEAGKVLLQSRNPALGRRSESIEQHE